MRRKTTTSDQSNEVNSLERAELARLTDYLDALRRLIEIHDKAPARWRYFQTGWLWLYARGMVAGEHATVVRERRLAELESERKGRPGSARQRCLGYEKIEMFGGPADGQVIYDEVPVADQLTVTAKTLSGRTTKVTYRRDEAAPGDTLFILTTGEPIVDSVIITHAFKGRRPVRYRFVPRRRRGISK